MATKKKSLKKPAKATVEPTAVAQPQQAPADHRLHNRIQLLYQ